MSRTSPLASKIIYVEQGEKNSMWKWNDGAHKKGMNEDSIFY